MNKITIAIPAYNNARTIKESIESAINQQISSVSILISDDCSTDDTLAVIQPYLKDKRIKLLTSTANIGIGRNITKLMNACNTNYIIYLCADDVFTNPFVVEDAYHIFKENSKLGVIGRYFYYFLDGHSGAIGVCRDKNILTNSCCPSGIALRVLKDVEATNDIFIEMPSLIAQYLNKGYEWTMLEYDTIAARFWPGGNTGTKKEYYTQSQLKNWLTLTGNPLRYCEGFIQLKNRAPHMLIPEITFAIKTDKGILKDWKFWIYSATAIIVPGFILRKASVMYRHYIQRRFSKIIERPV